MSFIYRDKFWYYTINTVLSILVLFPILIILILSFKTTTEIRLENFFSQFTFNNFFSIWDLEIRTNKNTFKQSFFNSLLNQSQRELIIKDYDLNKNEIIDLDKSRIVKSNYSLIKDINWNEKKSDIKNYKLSELIYWFKNPQKYWLNKNNISPKEIFIHHPDEEYVSNLQKSQLITKIIQQVEIDNNNIIDALNELNINDQ